MCRLGSGIEKFGIKGVDEACSSREERVESHEARSKKQEARSSINEKFALRGGEHITEDYIFLPASPWAVFSPNLTAQVTNQLNLHLHDGMAPLFPYMCNEERRQSRCFEYWSFVTESESR